MPETKKGTDVQLMRNYRPVGSEDKKLKGDVITLPPDEAGDVFSKGIGRPPQKPE